MTKLMFPFLIIVFLCAISCKDDAGDVRKLAAEKGQLLCAMERLRLENESHWDDMTRYLDETLPRDMPLPERQNMVNTRNAHLLTVFRIFPSLDSAVQHKVHWAKEKDDAMAAAMKAIMEKVRRLDRDINTILAKIEKKAPQGAISLKQELQRLESQPCK